MKGTILISAVIFLSAVILFPQPKVEADIEITFQNAKKGIYWGLSNLPLKKVKIENDLIADDKLYAVVKVTKEVDGYKIESTGYHNSNELSIKIYRSNNSLTADGYLKEEKASANQKE